MSATIGIIGGGNITRLGSASELAMFFRIVERSCSDHIPEKKLNLVTETLYRGNVRSGDFEALECVWREVFRHLCLTPLDRDTADGFVSDIARKKLDWSASTWGSFFGAYEDALMNAIEGARFEIEDYKLDPRIRIGVAEVPAYKAVEELSDEDFETCGSTPIWLV